jgi:hypothetical protein
MIIQIGIDTFHLTPESDQQPLDAFLRWLLNGQA